jgi:hypothetical protein
MPRAALCRCDALRRDSVDFVGVQGDKGQGREWKRDSGRSARPRVCPRQYCHVSERVIPGTSVADLVISCESHLPKFECSITPRDKLAEDLIRASALA